MSSASNRLAVFTGKRSETSERKCVQESLDHHSPLCPAVRKRSLRQPSTPGGCRGPGTCAEGCLSPSARRRGNVVRSYRCSPSEDHDVPTLTAEKLQSFARSLFEAGGVPADE